MDRNFTIKNYYGRTVEVEPQFVLYNVQDFMGKLKNIIGLDLVEISDKNEEPFEDRITKSFGEFISLKNCAYIDLNNCPYATELLELGIAKDTGYTKHSGLCEYPLWQFDEKFLEDIGGELYTAYLKQFNQDLGNCFGVDEETFEQSM